MNRDNTIFELIEKEHQRQLKGIELIASENFVSDQVQQVCRGLSWPPLLWWLPGSRRGRAACHRPRLQAVWC